MEQPLLLSKLQTALACLYNAHTNEHHRCEAHQFLLTFKSSNLRRLVVSRLQSQKDKSDNKISFEDDLQRHAEESTSHTAGSIYLSCLALLLTPINANGRHEQIFAAQTLNHRCRSIKLVESFDIEAEDGLECGVARLVLAWEERRRNGVNYEGEESKIILNAWLERYAPMLVHRSGRTTNNNLSLCHGGKLLEMVFERHSSSLSAGNDEGERGEERMKGNLIMLTLAVALYTAAFTEYEEDHYFAQQKQQQQHRNPWANAVLSELGSALSVTALRIRYRPTTNRHDTPTSEAGVPSLIDLLIHSIHLVADAATGYFVQQANLGDDRSKRNLAEVCHQHAIKRSIAACLTCLPETVLLPPSSDRGDDSHRIPSIDRACLRAASIELRSESNAQGATGTGMERMLIEIIKSELGDTNIGDLAELDNVSAARILECCDSWARFVMVPLHVIDVTVQKLAVRYFHFGQNETQTSSNHQKAQTQAFQYLTSIFEGASPSLTVQDILSATLGVAVSGVGGTKKKQGNKSKKRQERRLNNASIVFDADGTGSTESGCSAEEELSRRKNSACVAAASIFGVSVNGDGHSTETTLRLSSPTMYTHSICSTVSTAASSVLPSLLSLERNANENNNTKEQWWSDSFEIIVISLKRLCQSANRDVRGLSYEPLMILHESLNSTPVVRLRVEQIAVDNICECALALSISCSYPTDYFRDLSIDNDEELEFERNDVRDVVRSVSSLDSGNFGGDNSKSPSILILEYFLNTIHSTIHEAAHHSILPQESIIHALSALAKPLNKLGKKYAELPSQNDVGVIITTLSSYHRLFEQLNTAFQYLSTSQILPDSRLGLMGVASLAPFFSSLADVKQRQAPNEAELRMIQALDATLRVALEHSILATTKIPELAAESTLKITRYDIRGTMRGPGGEDHVGCIALMRLSFESEHLAFSIIDVYPSLLRDIASMYNELKVCEQNRPIGCNYGIGVCPISRRLVLKALSRLCVLQINRLRDEIGNAILNELVQVPLKEIYAQKDMPISTDKLFRLCESVYDLASFDSQVIAGIPEDLANVFDCVCESLISGYSRLSFTSEIDPWFQQWARLRGAVVCLLRTCCKHSMTNCIADVLSVLLNAEIETAKQQSESHSSGSSIFNDQIIGEDNLHAGAYLIVVQESLSRVASDSSDIDTRLFEFRMCMKVLKTSVTNLTNLLLCGSPEASSYTDPRPTLAEAWFVTMTSVVSIYKTELSTRFSSDDGIEDLIGLGLGNISVGLILMKHLGTKTRPLPLAQAGMSLDGPQTLSMLEFMRDAIDPNVLASASRHFAAHFKIEHMPQSKEIGGSIVAAGLLRAASGAFPPWAVELTPAIFRSLFIALGSNIDVFIHIIECSFKLEVSGEVLAGRYFESVSSVHINSFLSKTRDACSKGEWNKLKSIIKTACGGKKKESGFNLKPQFTCWDCERL